MNEKTSGPTLQHMLFSQLRNPIKLRFLLCVVLLASWYFGFYGPTSEQIILTSAKADSELKRAVCARQIEGLREALAPFQSRIPDHSGQNELNQYVLEHIRQTSIKLVDLRPARIKDLGSFNNIGMRLQLEASYEELDDFLVWVENSTRLLRIDVLRIDPGKGNTRLNVQLDLLSLAEKEKNRGGEIPPKDGKTGTKR